ncbi:HU family DNA-binding protein [Acidobacteriota bacterium]
MNKADLIERVAKDARLTKVQAAKALDSTLTTISKALKKNEKVTLVGFGAWTISKRKAREGRNPRTGEPIKIKASKVVKFTAGKNLKKQVQ